MQEAGHYYTTYFVSLAVGFDPYTALRNAVFAQMPDEVNALDAKYQGINAAIEGASATYELGSGMWDRATIERNFIELERAKFELDLIQRGLHALTGGSSETERSLTQSALCLTKPGTMEFGFLLHRFGDSYAHSVIGDEKRMYDTGWGHTVPSLMGSSPDMLHRRPGLYVEYVKQLFVTLTHLARSTQAMSPAHCMSADEVTKVAQEIAGMRLTADGAKLSGRNGEAHRGIGREEDLGARTGVVHVWKRPVVDHPHDPYRESGRIDDDVSENSQIRRMRHLCREHMRIEMDPYKPEADDCMSWDRYKERHGQFMLQPDGKTEIKWADVAAAVHNVARLVGQEPRQPRHGCNYPLRPQ